MIGIYKITSPTNKVYIGQSHNIEKRFAQYKGLKCKDQPRIYNSLKKHGIQNHYFEVVCEIPKGVNQSILDYSEQFHMDAYRAMGFELMNLREAGSKGAFSEESKRKLSISSKGKNTWTKGLKRTDEQKKALSERVRMWHHDNGRIPKKRMSRQEVREFMSKLKKGVERPMYKGEGNPFFGKKHTEETRLKLSEHNRKNKTGANNGRARAILQYDLNGNLIKEWDTVTNASNELGIKRTTISGCLRGDTVRAKQFVFKYKP